MRPRVICHMVQSIDGKTEPSAYGVEDTGYDETAEELNSTAWICGRVTMQDFAKFQDPTSFVPQSDAKAGPRKPFLAKRTGSYAISADTRGIINWNKNEIYGDHLVCLVSESAPADYLVMLEQHAISYIVAGHDSIDFAAALEVIGTELGVERLLLEGGGHINGALLDRGLVDEVSLLVLPAIDGRHEPAGSFDGRATSARGPKLTLASVKQRANGILWLRYDVVR